MLEIDLNCDLGEGAPHDAELMAWITSANIACGAHAGDPETMRATLRLAHRHGVSAGAHPGYEDRANFGRLDQTLDPTAVQALVLRQIRNLQAIAREEGVPLRHVKPHGALYNQAAKDAGLARAVAAAVKEADARLCLFGLAGSRLLAEGRAAGLRVVAEAFPDRSYQADGTLTPRSRPGALIEDELTVARQAIAMAQGRTVRSLEGGEVRIEAGTLCLHGDGPHAVAFARRLAAALDAAGIRRRAPSA